MMVHVSSLNNFEFCPRVIYLRDVRGIKPGPSEARSKGLIGHSIRKELNLRQARLVGRICDVSELENAISGELESILADVPYIYRDMLDEINVDRYLKELMREFKAEARLMIERLSGMIDELGFEKSLRLVTPWKVEYSLRSENLRLSGRIDKIMKECKLIPVEIKTGQPSETVWEGDRLQICAYAMLLEEKFEKSIPFGFVEYTRLQERRPVMSTEQLRRKVIYTRNEIIDILNGKVPDICPHGSGKRCNSCGFMDECYVI